MVEKQSRPKKAASVSKKADVNDFMASLEHPLRAEIEVIRSLILGADGRVREAIKWNAPSFYIDEHFATFKLRPAGLVQVVFHTGAKVRADAKPIEIDDPTGLLTWAAPDRCMATLADMDDITARKAAFLSVVEQWIEQTVGSAAT